MGRFQPFHNGHLKAINYILEREDHLHIVIGSSRKSYTRRNPFSSGERYQMVKNSLQEAGIDSDRYDIFQIADANEGTVWRQRIINHVPHFYKVYSHLGDTMLLFDDIGYETVEIPRFTGRTQERGSFIRESMSRRTHIWHNLVPRAVVDFLGKIGGAYRVHALNLED